MSSEARSRLLTSAAPKTSTNWAVRRQKMVEPQRRHLRCTSDRSSGAESSSLRLYLTTSCSIVSCWEQGAPRLGPAAIGQKVMGTLGAERGSSTPSNEYQYRSLPHH
eukprot:scaffold5589_cov115-Isochrysis_galbana.AAC.1